ncbi:MAG: hypothetical protein HGA76_11830, partial [Candidatus Firestonebacteria bacterium]|nr:hypothetical protein [Candidatus Firestonebacteria bacterium]
MRPVSIVGTIFSGVFLFSAAVLAAEMPASENSEWGDDSQEVHAEAAPRPTAIDQEGKIKLSAAVQTTYIDFLRSGPALPATLRYRPWNQFIDLTFLVNPTDHLNGEAVFRLENVFGGYWGEQNSYAVRRLYIKGDYPVSFCLGDYNAKLTPLTLQAQDDANELDARFFTDKEQRNRRESYLLPDGTWPLTGYQVGYYQFLDEPNHIGVGIESFGARIGVQGTATDYFTFAHDQYLVVAAGKLDLSKSFQGGAAVLNQFDVPETGDSQAAVFKNRINDFHGSLNLWPDHLTVQGEFASSQSNTDSGRANYFSDQAVNLNLMGGTEYFKLKVAYFQIGGDYFAPGAQTRLQDARINLPIITENNTWDAASNWFSTPPILPHYNPAYPLNKYNNRILASQRLAFFPYEDNLFPYGQATPNRNGYECRLDLDVFNPYVQPIIKYAAAREIKDATGDGKRNFVLKEIGSKFAWSWITGSVDYQNEDTNNGNHIGLTSTTLRGGLEFKVLPDFEVLLGYKHQDFNGSEFIGNL